MRAIFETTCSTIHGSGISMRRCEERSGLESDRLKLNANYLSELTSWCSKPNCSDNGCRQRWREYFRLGLSLSNQMSKE